MIQTSDSSRIYVGNNSAVTPYPVPFYFANDEDLVVTQRAATGAETRLVLGTDYICTGHGNPNGGSITTLWPVPIEDFVSIARVVPLTQLLSYQEGDSFPAKAHEGGLDKLTCEIQQVARGVGDGTGSADDIGYAFRVTQASGGIKSLVKLKDTTVGIDENGEAILRTPSAMLGWLGQVGTVWANDGARATTRGAFAGQTGVQLDNWAIYIARSTAPGDWVPDLKESGVVISTNGVPTAKFNPAGDIVGTEQAQQLNNKTLNAPAIHNPTGLTSADVGLGNCDNTSDQDKPISAPIQLALQSKQDIAVKGFQNGYASLDGAGKVPIEQIPSSLIGGNASFQTSWNATTNTPAIPPASPVNNGFYYLVAVAGTTTIDGISSWAVGDTIISDGAVWKKITSTALVSSVAGKIGAVTLIKGDVGLSAVDNTSDATKNAAAVTLTNHTIKGSQNVIEVRLDADVINSLPVSKLNGGAGAGPNTWWCGDQTWKQPQGTGDTTGVTSSVVGESVVFRDTDGKHIGGYAGPAGFAILTPGNTTTAKPKLDAGDMDPAFIHDLAEKTATLEDDEFLLWDSVTGQLMKVKKKNLGVPVATVVDYCGLAAPAGWLFCDGSTKLKVDYPALWTALQGTAWATAAATPATQFLVPDFRGMVAAGRDNMGGTNANRLSTMGAGATTLAGNGGLQTHTLTATQIAAHQHIVPNHSHPITVFPSYQTMRSDLLQQRAVFWDTQTGGNTGGSGDFWSQATGGNGAHNNIQPTLIVNKIIKY